MNEYKPLNMHKAARPRLGRHIIVKVCLLPYSEVRVLNVLIWINYGDKYLRISYPLINVTDLWIIRANLEWLLDKEKGKSLFLWVQNRSNRF